MIDSLAANSHTNETDGVGAPEDPVNATPKKDMSDVPSADDVSADNSSSSNHHGVKRKLADFDGNSPQNKEVVTNRHNLTDAAKSDTTTTSSAHISNANESSNSNQMNIDNDLKQSHSPESKVLPPSNKPKTDIYGRIPLKEPKYPISCPTCSRNISVSRFAAHLEKCLGISGRSLGGASKHSK